MTVLLFLRNSPLFLYRYNLFCAIVHFLSSTVLLILTLVYSSKLLYSDLTTDFSIYDTVAKKPKVETVTIATYSNAYLLFPFGFITSLFHVFLASRGQYWLYLYRVTVLGRNPYRWIEYSITASLMIWVVWSVSGGTNIFQGISIVILNIIMNLCGLEQEDVNKTRNTPEHKESSGYQKWVDKLINTFPTSYKHMNIIGSKKEMVEYKEYCNSYKKDIKTRLTSGNNDISLNALLEVYGYENIKEKPTAHSLKTNYFPFVLGCLPFILTWVIVFSYFFTALTKNASNVPWWVWTIDIGLFITFSQFAVIMLIHYIQKDNLINEANKHQLKGKHILPWGKTWSTYFADRTNQEVIYQLLSLTSKLFLPWFLWIGLFTRG